MKYIKYIILFVIFTLLSACSDIPNSHMPKNSAPAPLGGSSSSPAPIEMPPRADNDTITPSISPSQQDVQTPAANEENAPPAENAEENAVPEENAAENEVPKENVPEILTEVSTPIYNDSENRVVNLNLAAEAISGTTLAPGEVFSFNETVGRRSSEKGYKKAPIVVNGDHVKGVGGGVCQISTTLYLAVDDCGLEILERHRHKEGVAYSPGGKDCTVNYGDLDFKFKNTSDKTIKIDISVEDEKVTAKILTDF